MADHETSPKALFEELSDRFLTESDVSQDQPVNQPKQRFGATALKTDGKIFTMLVKDRLVVKLPRQRVSALISAGEGGPFETQPGRAMKEWVTIPASTLERWLELAEEARGFVGSVKG